MAAKIAGGVLVGINLETFRYLVNGKTVMAADIPAGRLLLDVPEASNKMFSFPLDKAETYQVETIVTIASGIVTYTHAPVTGMEDISPNLRRNEFSGQFDTFNVYRLPSQMPPATP